MRNAIVSLLFLFMWMAAVGCSQAELDASAGENALQEKNYIKAIGFFDKAIKSPELPPFDRTNVYYNRGLAYYRLKNATAAEKDLKMSLKHWSENRKALELLIDINLIHADCAEALKNAEILLQMDEHSHKGIFTKGWVFATCPNAKFRNGKKSLEVFNGLVEEHQHEWSFYLGLAAAYAELGQFKEAVETQNQSIAMAGRNLPDWVSEYLELYRNKKPLRKMWGGGEKYD